MSNRFWVPPAVSEEMLEQRRQREAQGLKALQTDALFAEKKRWDRELAAIDPGLKLVWCPDPAPIEAAAMGAVPGRWNLMRAINGVPPTFIALQTPEGDYLEPGSHIFETLARSDLWDERNMRERERRVEQLRRASAREKEREREERQQEIKERMKAIRETSVSMNRDVPWSQNVAGRKTNGKG